MSHATQDNHTSSLAGLTLGAIGVVYGDIGTSVLYSIKEVLLEDTKNQPSIKAGLLFRMTAILRLFSHLRHGG